MDEREGSESKRESEPGTTRRSKELAAMAAFYFAAIAAFWALGWNPGALVALGVLTAIGAAVTAMKR